MPIEKFDDRLDRIVSGNAEIKLLADGLATAEGPVWFEEDGALVFSEVGYIPTPTGFEVPHQGRRLKWWPGERRLTVLQEPTGRANGLTRDPEGRLILCESGTGRVTRLEGDGSITEVATEYHGRRLGIPNDVVVKSDGAIYFTDDSGMAPGGEIDENAVYRVSPDLKHINRVAAEFQCVNGLAFSPDERILYINDSQGIYADPDTFRSQGTIRAYDVRASGMLANSRLFCELRGERSGMPDGMKCDREGNVYCTGPGGIWVIDPAGNHLGTILTDVRHNVTNPTNVGWGGSDWTTLFITTASTLLSIELRIPGVPVRSKLRPTAHLDGVAGDPSRLAGGEKDDG